MEAQHEQIREQQKQSWNKFSPGWQKWDEFNMAFLKPMGDAIISALKIADGDEVLDIAAGTGEPGITIATLTPSGKVIGTDLSEKMLLVARVNADEKGIKNYSTVVADVCELLFDDAVFNAISCRMGFMFFPDMTLAAQEMHRVLKPGGRIATSVWAGPDGNTWVTTIMSIIQKHITLPAPVQGAPGMFRCSKPEVLTDIFKQAGFKNIAEQLITGKVDYKSFDIYWEMMLDVGAPIVAAMANASDATKQTIKKEVEELFLSKNKDGEAVLDYAALVVYGEKLS